MLLAIPQEYFSLWISFQGFIISLQVFEVLVSELEVESFIVQQVHFSPLIKPPLE